MRDDGYVHWVQLTRERPVVGPAVVTEVRVACRTRTLSVI